MLPAAFELAEPIIELVFSDVLTLGSPDGPWTAAGSYAGEPSPFS